MRHFCYGPPSCLYFSLSFLLFTLGWISSFFKFCFVSHFLSAFFSFPSFPLCSVSEHLDVSFVSIFITAVSVSRCVHVYRLFTYFLTFHLCLLYHKLCNSLYLFTVSLSLSFINFYVPTVHLLLSSVFLIICIFQSFCYVMCLSLVIYYTLFRNARWRLFASSYIFFLPTHFSHLLCNEAGRVFGSIRFEYRSDHWLL